MWHERVRRGGVLLLLALAAAACGPKTPPATAPPATPAAAAATVAAIPLRSLPGELDRIFAAPAFHRMQWGVVVQSLESGQVLYERDASRLMMPASNMKIVTLAAAAERLGWDYTWPTTVIPAGRVVDGVLRGDLVVRGGGDPTINGRGGDATQVFSRWADLLLAGGLKRVEGRVVADAGAFDDEGLGAGWAWDYLAYGYAAPVSALQFNEDVAQIVVRPGPAEGAPAVVVVQPVESGLVAESRVITVAGDTASLALRRLPGSDRLVVSGSIGQLAEETMRAVTVESPSVYFARALRRVLVEKGIEVFGPATDIASLDVKPVLDQVAPLLTHRSPPLSEAARVLMKVSQNLYAETFLKTIGAVAGEAGSAEAGQKEVAAVLQGWGVAPDEYVLADGSGLSRYNYVTPHMLVTILRQIYRDPRHRDRFIATLPVGGEDGGTIARRFKGTRAAGNVRAKTGSIANVRALSGYVTTLDGEPLVFSIIANDFTLPQATIDAATDQAVERLANVTRR
ncbi:MAG TPA: D-alanyl-D-alanine carboxypeptidase/D-alanyl-D-alanine-endopeptidase [Vicinamibacterales bacterium]|nr:D-alanyl-D-alanine carboxypeptidase/D-alanyl-D-alanine-endopeptidase [Vicinamibacterales bacterium]